MRITTLTYEETKNLGNYESQKIGIEIVLDSEDKPGEALRRAKEFVAAGSKR